MKTYPRVIELLKSEAEKGSVNRIVYRTGLNHNTITSYLGGRSEPTQSSLEKIANAFGTTVAWLRGDAELPIMPNHIDLSNLSPTKRRLVELIRDISEERAKSLLILLES